MRNLKVITGLALLVLLFPFLFSCSDPASVSSGTHYERVAKVVDSIRVVLETQLNKPVPSLSVLIQTPTELIFFSSASVSSTPITKDTYFRFASNTKNFTSASLLNMMEDGWVDINAYITDTIPGTNVTYVPSTPEWNIPNKSQIKIKQIMQHSAGIFDVSNDTVPGCGGLPYVVFIENLDPNHQFNVTEFANQLTTKNLLYFPPGAGYHYSNTGYAILSDIIGRVYSAKTGQTKLYSDYINDFITGSNSPVPVNIHFPHLQSDRTMPNPYVNGNEYLPNGTTKVYSDVNISANVGEGNGYGTMLMLNTYIRSMMKGTNVLTTNTIQIMKTTVSPSNMNYGLGCAYIHNLGYGHTGATHGYFSNIFYDPQTDVSVISLLPLWDNSGGDTTFFKCFYATIDAMYASRVALGFSGKP